MSNLDDFEPTDFKRWEQQAKLDLKLEDLEAFMSVELSDGITQAPYVDFTTRTDSNLISAYRNCTLHQGEHWQGARHWLNMERIESGQVSEANQLALKALEAGADGVVFNIDLISNWEQLLSGISLSDCYLGFEGASIRTMSLLDYAQSKQLPLKGFVKHQDLPKLLADQTISSELLVGHDDIRTLVIEEADGKPGSLQEIARILSHAVQLINLLLERQVPLPQIVKNFQCNLSLSNAYIWEICRLRCLRILFHQMVCQYGQINYTPGSFIIHTSTSSLQDNEKDQNQMLLSNTVQALAAVLGGCNILTVTPHQGGYGGDNDFARRISRNVSHILREESYLHKVADPVAGSYYMENLTRRMLEEVWARFRHLEHTGGYSKLSIVSR